MFKAGELPRIDPGNPALVLAIGSLRVEGRVNPKAARKLAVHQGGAVLQGRLEEQSGKLVLADAGFTWIEPKPPSAETAEGPTA